MRRCPIGCRSLARRVAVLGDLCLHLFRRLELGSTEGAVEEGMIDEARLLAFDLDQTDGHVNHVVLTDYDQRVEILSRHGLLELAAARSECLGVSGRIGACCVAHIWLLVRVRQLPPASRPSGWLHRSCRPYRTPARGGDRSR